VPELAALIRSIRTERGETLSGAARRACLSKSTLWSWEAGASRPCVPELERLFDAFDVPRDERLPAYDMLDAPRGYRRAEEIHAPIAPGVQRLLGLLIRGMRSRRALTQAQVASALGVGRSAIARWEEGARRPNAGETESLCTALGALDAERSALLGGRRALATLEWALFPDGSDCLTRAYRTAYHLQTAPDVALRNVRFAVLLAALGSERERGRADPTVAAMALSLYAEELLRLGDCAAARDRLHDAWALVGTSGVVRSVPRLVPLVAEVSARRRRGGAALAIRTLGDHMDGISNPGVRGWMAADMARALALEGEAALAVEHAQLACRYAEASRNRHEIWHRCHDLPRVLLLSGDIAGARRAFEDRFRLDDANCTIRDMLLLADIEEADGAAASSEATLASATSLAASTDRTHLLRSRGPRGGGIR